MVRKSLNDYVCEVLQGKGFIEASRIKDLLFEKMGGGTPSIRELNASLKKNCLVISQLAPAGTTQIKKYALKKMPEKKLSAILREGERR